MDPSFLGNTFGLGQSLSHRCDVIAVQRDGHSRDEALRDEAFWSRDMSFGEMSKVLYDGVHDQDKLNLNTKKLSLED